MIRMLLIMSIACSIVSIAAYSVVRSLYPGLLDALECAVQSCVSAADEAAAQGVSPKRVLEPEIDRYFAPLVATNNFYGTVYVVSGDDVLADKGYGSASIELGVPNASASVFQIASVSKPFTAAAVMLLAQRGLVDLQAPLANILPDYPNGNRLTLHHLLLHTSGIPDINVQPVYAELSHAHRTPADLVAAFAHLPLQFEPGARFQYSNSNYNLLALVIERVSKMTYGEFVRREILEPLNLRHTGHPDRAETIVPNSANGYLPIDRSGLARAPWIDWTAKTGNGSLYSTAEDLARWVRGFFHGGLLNPETLALATTPRLSNIGIDSMRGDLSYVWSIGRLLDRKKVWFAGRSPGFSAAVSYFPEADLAIVVLSNTYSLVTTQAADAIAAMAFGAPYTVPQIDDAPLPPETARRWVGTYQFGERAPVPHMKMRVAEQDGRLTLEPDFAQIAPSALLPTGDGVFMLRSYWLELKFDAEPNAAAKALTLFGARAERIE
jgi:CubicO group peptidase (beta-lactamase class C family)